MNVKEYHFSCSQEDYNNMVKQTRDNIPKLEKFLDYLEDLCDDFGYPGCDVSTVYDPQTKTIVFGVMSDVPEITNGWRTFYIADVRVKVVPEEICNAFNIKPCSAVFDLLKVPELLNDFALLSWSDIPFMVYYPSIETLKITTTLDLSPYDRFSAATSLTVH